MTATAATTNKRTTKPPNIRATLPRLLLDPEVVSIFQNSSHTTAMVHYASLRRSLITNCLLYVPRSRLYTSRVSQKYCSVAVKDPIMGWTPTGGRISSIIHQMKAKNLRRQKLRDAGTKRLYNWRYCTFSMAIFLK